LTIAKVFFDHRHDGWIHIDLSVAGLALRGHFLRSESAPTNTNHRLFEVEIFDMKTSQL